jgi:hypothetical protein
LILAASATVPLVIPRYSPPSSQPPPEKPHNFPEATAELAPWLTSRLPHVRVMPAPPTDNFYLAADSVPETVTAEDLGQLPRRPNVIEKWSGVVYVAQCLQDPRLYDRSYMGDFGFVAPPYLFFGDPDMMTKIKRVMD